MIKLILQLVMPKQLSIFGALAFGSFAFGVIESIQTQKKVEKKQEEQSAVERGVQEEQAGRERRKQVRQANILQAQAESVGACQGGQVAGGSSGGVQSSISANLFRNTGAIDFSLQSANAISSARQATINAGRPSTLGIVNQQLQPLLFSNIDKLDTFFDKAFSS